MEVVNHTVVKGELWMAAFVLGQGPVEPDNPDASPILGDPQGRYYIPRDLTGYTAKLQLKRHPTAPVIKTLTVGSGLTLVAVDGIINLRTLADWTDRVVEYSLKITSPSGDPETPYKGLVYLEPEVTQ